MAVLLTPPELQFFDSDGVTPLANGKVFTYSAGTTTPKAAFTTAAGDVELANPVILDSVGKAIIWISGSYQFIVKDADDVTISTTDNVTSFTALPATSDSYFESFSGTGSQAAFTTSDDLGTDEKAIYVWVDAGLEEAVTNGDFATDSDWTKGTGWSIGSGVATAAGAISVAISQTSAVTIVEGQAYSVTYTITRSAGGLIPSVGGNSGTEQVASGTYTEVIIGGSTEVLAFTGNSFTGTLDDVSITVASTAGFNIINPSAYTIAATTLTFATAPAAGTNNIYVSAPSLLVGAASSSAADAAASATAAAADLVLTNADVVSTNADVVTTNADVVQTNADVVSTNADVVSTGNDVTTASEWASKTTGLVAATDYSSKAWAIGGTGTTTNNSKYYSEQAAAIVTGDILILEEQGSTPSTPATGDSKLYFNTDGSLRTLDDAGAELIVVANSSGVGGLTLGTPQATTSGTSIDFTSIPSGTKQIFINLDQVSTDGVSPLGVQIGDAGGIETSNYKSALGATIDASPAVGDTLSHLKLQQAANAADNTSGIVTLNLLNSSTNLWAMTGVLTDKDGASAVFIGAASKALSAELDRVRFTTIGGTDNFDLGAVNISYQ